MRSWKSKLVSCVMSVVLVVGLCPGFAYAGRFSSASASAQAIGVDGVIGTCVWSISEDGVLTIGPKDDDGGVLPSDAQWPWHSYGDQITSVVFEDGVKLGSSAEGMFLGCSAVEVIEFADLDTSDVTTFAGMFDGCSSLEEIDLSGFSTSHAVTMISMFNGCSALRELDLSSFDTGCVGSMQGIFGGCAQLESLDVSSFVMADGLNQNALLNMFDGCSSLRSIRVGASFRFDASEDGNLPDPPSEDPYTGYWQDEDGALYGARDLIAAHNAHPREMTYAWAEDSASGDDDDDDDYNYGDGHDDDDDDGDGDGESVVDYDEFWDWDIEVDDAYVDGAAGRAVPVIVVEYDGEEVDAGLYTLAYELLDDEGKPTGTTYPENTMLGVGYYMARVSVSISNNQVCSWGTAFRVIDRYDISSAEAYASQVVFDGGPVDLAGSVQLYFNHDNRYSFWVERLGIDQDFKIAGYRDVQGNDLDGAPSSAGNYKVILEGIDPYHGVKVVDFTVIDAYDLSGASIWADRDIVEAADGVSPSFYGHIGNTSLKQDVDFHIAGYKDSTGEELAGAPATAGTYYAVLEGNDPYHGAKDVAFTVFRANDLARAYAECVTKTTHLDYGYTGSPIEVTLSVRMPDGTELEEGVDYTVSYAEYDWDAYGPGAPLSGAPTEMGTYYAVVTAVANGQYVGSNGCQFSIVDPKNLGSGNVRSPFFAYATYPWNNGLPVSTTDITVVDVNGKTLKEGTDYVLLYSPYGNHDPDKYRAGISDEGVYEVHAKGIGSYSGLAYGSPIVRVCVAKPEHDITKATVSMPATYAYDGGSSLVGTVSPVVTLAGKTLVEGEDYRLFFDKSGGTTSGTLGEHTFHVIGLGSDGHADCDYYGTLALKYTVVDTDISHADVSGIATRVYTGKKVTQSPTVKIGSTTLREKIDYTLSYKNNTNAGEATVAIKGAGAYSGTQEKTFTIKKASLSSVALKVASGNYNGQAYKPKVEKVKASSVTVPSSDYTVSYLRGKSSTKDLKTSGTITVKATAKKNSVNFTGSATATFTIKQIANPMKLKTAIKTAKLAKGKKKLAKATTVSGAISFTKKGQGTVAYEKVAKGSSRWLTVAKKTGKITVAKNTPKGTYKIKVNVTAAGNSNYKKLTKPVIVTVRVA